jgi:hypothetical protein
MRKHEGVKPGANDYAYGSRSAQVPFPPAGCEKVSVRGLLGCNKVPPKPGGGGTLFHWFVGGVVVGVVCGAGDCWKVRRERDGDNEGRRCDGDESEEGRDDAMGA